MSYHLFYHKKGKKVHFPTISEPTQIDLAVCALGIIIKAGKYFPVISVSLTSLNVFFAVNDFLSNNIGFAMLNSAFAASGLVFLVQTVMEKSHHGMPLKLGTA